MSEEKSIPEIPYEPLSRGGSVHDHGFAYVASDPGPELVTLPEGAQVYPFVPLVNEKRAREIFAEMLATPEARAFVQAIVRETLEEDARAICERKEFQPTRQAGICYACLCTGDDMERFEQGGQGVWIHKTDECRQRAIAIAEHKAHEANVPAGVCWACKRSGKAAEMEWRDMHLIHATEYCRDLAASLPPVREHRG